VLGVFDRAEPGVHLAIAMNPVLPSVSSDSVGAPDYSKTYAAQYPARTCPCQRFKQRTHLHHSGSAWVANPSPHDSSIPTSSPVTGATETFWTLPALTTGAGS